VETEAEKLNALINTDLDASDLDAMLDRKQEEGLIVGIERHEPYIIILMRDFSVLAVVETGTYLFGPGALIHLIGLGGGAV